MKELWTVKVWKVKYWQLKSICQIRQCSSLPKFHTIWYVSQSIKQPMFVLKYAHLKHVNQKLYENLIFLILNFDAKQCTLLILVYISSYNNC